MDKDRTVDTIMGRLDELAAIGVVPGVGLWRRPYTAEETQAIELVGTWMEAAGLQVHRDAAGNLIGRAEGDGAQPAVVTGSHLDSVKNGGRFDGPLGVVGGLAAVESLLKAHGSPRRPLEVIAFVGEEGSRFPTSLIGSKALTGRLSADDTASEDEGGVKMAEAMRSVGLQPEKLASAERSDIHAFLELHIEQGRVLEAAGLPAGIVSAIVGMHQVAVRLRGRADHAGTTPMKLRRDPLAGAARMIVAMTDRVREEGSVVTIGRMSVKPGATNIVPSEVAFTIDFRHTEPKGRQVLFEWLETCCRDAARASELEIEWDVFHDQEPVAMDAGVVGALEAAAATLGMETLAMPSGAGHDAMVMAQRFPTGMVFVPSKDGRSHTPEEWSEPGDIEGGVALLAEALRRLAY